MNIFYVDSNAEVAARNMVDRHVVKMILETAQLLSTAHRVIDGEEYVGQSQSGRKAKRWRLSGNADAIMYAATHINHPSAVWVRENSANYAWLYDHLLALGREYTYRYGRTHLTIDKLKDILKDAPENIEQSNVMTKMPSCMDKQYIVSLDPIINYRNYYNYGKTDLLRWSNRPPPQWIDGTVILTDGKKQIYTIQR
jgi:hypothetical protein